MKLRDLAPLALSSLLLSASPQDGVNREGTPPARPEPVTLEAATAAFARADRDADGFLSPAEAAGLGFGARTFASSDPNRSGTLADREFLAAYPAVLAAQGKVPAQDLQDKSRELTSELAKRRRKADQKKARQSEGDSANSSDGSPDPGKEGKPSAKVLEKRSQEARDALNEDLRARGASKDVARKNQKALNKRIQNAAKQTKGQGPAGGDPVSPASDIAPPVGGAAGSEAAPAGQKPAPGLTPSTGQTPVPVTTGQTPPAPGQSGKPVPVRAREARPAGQVPASGDGTSQGGAVGGSKPGPKRPRGATPPRGATSQGAQGKKGAGTPGAKPARRRTANSGGAGAKGQNAGGGTPAPGGAGQAPPVRRPRGGTPGPLGAARTAPGGPEAGKGARASSVATRALQARRALGRRLKDRSDVALPGLRDVGSRPAPSAPRRAGQGGPRARGGRSGQAPGASRPNPARPGAVALARRQPARPDAVAGATNPVAAAADARPAAKNARPKKAGGARAAGARRASGSDADASREAGTAKPARRTDDPAGKRAARRGPLEAVIASASPEQDEVQAREAAVATSARGARRKPRGTQRSGPESPLTAPQAAEASSPDSGSPQPVELPFDPPF